MDIIVSAKNLNLTPALKQYTEDKIGRINKFWSRIIRAHIELSMNRHHKHGDIFTAHAWVEIPGHDLRATTHASDMRAAIDLLYPKLERQIIRSKQYRTRSRD